MKKRTSHKPLKATVIKTEVDNYIQEILARNQPVETSWIIQGLMQQHVNIEGEDTPYYLRHALDNNGVLVRAALRKLGLVAELRGDAQLVLPGWVHLQQYYPLQRAEISHIVPMAQMSNEELMAKAEEYRAMGRGCFAHADELDRYREEKQATAAA